MDTIIIIVSYPILTKDCGSFKEKNKHELSRCGTATIIEEETIWAGIFYVDVQYAVLPVVCCYITLSEVSYLGSTVYISVTHKYWSWPCEIMLIINCPFKRLIELPVR